MLAAVAVRMRAILVVMILGAASLSLADERPRLRGVETPRATDLLHAKRLADRMEAPLRTPAAHGACRRTAARRCRVSRSRSCWPAGGAQGHSPIGDDQPR